MKRLAPSFGGGARFIPEKYKQSIVKIYTFLYLQKARFAERASLCAVIQPALAKKSADYLNYSSDHRLHHRGYMFLRLYL